MTLFTDEIRADFAAFADPATPLAVSDREISWIQNRRNMSVRLSKSAEQGFPNIRFQGQEFGYRQFFASTHMADLKAIAETQVRIANSHAYIGTDIEIAGSVGEGVSSLIELAKPKDRPRTSIVFLQGDAGSGKTTLLRQLSNILASDFIRGKSNYLTLYIDAQNRSLARLDEAIAVVLQDIRAQFTYHALATLSRIGLIVPIIDGFDELLGVRGYDDALSSLIRFLERLSGEGVVITSARSSFYRFHNIGWLSRNPSPSKQLDFDITTATIQPWQDSQIELAIEQLQATDILGFTHAHDVLLYTKSAITSQTWQLFSIPFFALSFYKMMKEIAKKPDKVPANTDWKIVVLGLLEEFAGLSLTLLVFGMISREIPKLRGRDDEPLLIPQDHSRFLEEVAEEMWLQETRVLDRSSVESLLEIVTESADRTTVLEILKGRAVVHPLLVSSSDGNLSFRHELFFSYFMAQVLWRYLESNDTKVHRLLGRSTLTTTMADELIILPTFSLVSQTSFPWQTFFDKLSPVDSPPSLKTTIRQNSGCIVAAAIRKHGDRLGLFTVNDLHFKGVSFNKSLISSAFFYNCEFEDADFRDTQWRNVDLATSSLTRSLVSPATNFHDVKIAGISSFHGLICEEEKTFDPLRIMEILASLGIETKTTEPVSNLNNEQRNRVKLLSRLIRATSSKFRFSRDDLENAGISRDPAWKSLEKSLLRHDILETDTISRRGSTGNLLRFAVSPDELESGRMSSPHEKIAAFWLDYLN